MKKLSLSHNLSIDQHQIDQKRSPRSNTSKLKMSNDIQDILGSDQARQESRATQDIAFAPNDMTVRTITNLQVDKIMIRKKKNKQGQSK